jgi:hypothetical protein
MLVSVLAYDRADYLARTLGALARCDGIERCALLVYSHTADYPEVRAVAERFVACPRFVVTGPDVAGAAYERVSVATFACLELAFALGDRVVHCEHDDTLAPDALDWFARMFERHEDDPTVFALGAFNHSAPEDRGRADEEIRDPHLVTHGLGLWADRWQEMRAGWDFKTWDRGLQAMRGERVQVRPRLSRSTNIGADAAGACGESAEWRRANMPAAVWSGEAG